MSMTSRSNQTLSLLVTRAAHCTLEREEARWFVVDGGSVDGTFVRRGQELRRVTERAPLHDGDAVCVLASITEPDGRRFFELAFQDTGDSQATRPVPEAVSPVAAPECLSYDADEARLDPRARGREARDRDPRTSAPAGPLHGRAKRRGRRLSGAVHAR